MPLDVIMPALGMAQESGVIVAWHKKPGDAVAEGDVLFEVETDKATMEVEAQGEGYLAGVSAKEGDEVAVGNVIARISETAEETGGDDTAPAASGPGATDGEGGGGGALPDGQQVIMPTLGMAQDSGLLVGWLVEPGGRVGADDPLFEVETDKSTMEVPAGADGYLAAQLAKAGDEVPTGDVIAIITADAPAETILRGRDEATGPAPAAAPAPGPAPEPAASGNDAPAKGAASGAGHSRPATAGITSSDGRILASPKARRLALERGLDLSRLVKAGVPQPFHASDIETLASLPAESAETAPAAGPAALRLTATTRADGTPAFMDWAGRNAGLSDPAALLAALAAPSLAGEAPVIACEAFATRRLFRITGPTLGAIEPADEGTPELVIRDLRASRITSVALGAEAAPVLSIMDTGDGLDLTLECAPGQLTPEAALALLNDVAGRMEDPLRYLL